jgi:HEXXH motif-containing protein
VTERHRLANDDFVALSQGYGGAQAIETLRNSQLSKRLLLLRYIAQAWPGRLFDRDCAIAALAEAQAHDPVVVRDILADPMVGAWSGRTVRRIRGSVSPDRPLHADLGHLGAVSAAAAARCGSDVDLVAYARHGGVGLPTMGCSVAFAAAEQPVLMRVRAGRSRKNMSSACGPTGLAHRNPSS